MEQNGLRVAAEEVQNLASIKARYQVPPELYSCHTAIVDGYVVEGHVPVEDIRRLLDERPEVIGLAVAGMPSGSPGMDDGSGLIEPYDVIAFNQTGPGGVFARYR